MVIDADMKIRAIAPWFGGKRTLAPRIVAELGKHVQYFEPFCGSMAVLFAKPMSQKETVCDLHADLTNLASVVSRDDDACALYDKLNRTLMSEGLLDEAREFLEQRADGASRIDWAYWFFIASWMGRNGTAGTERLDYQIAVRWTKNGGSPTVRFRSAVDSLPAWHQRLRNVVILNRDAFKIIDRFEDVEETVVYVDPPYPAETRSNLGGNNGGGGRYKHEFSHGESSGLFAGEDDHARLASILRAYKRARIVVSSYDCDRIRRLYAGWTVVDCAMNKQLHQQNGRGARRKEAPEILIINGPSLTADWKAVTA